ncbi:GD18712 [Drosophila simulans]|uniref:GD18712 n=1 Tax=Drosophila simulans TaxID=7240 RepID=B4QUN9_DROSI|nr:GD18712 [Drosophila simulans]
MRTPFANFDFNFSPGCKCECSESEFHIYSHSLVSISCPAESECPALLVIIIHAIHAPHAHPRVLSAVLHPRVYNHCCCRCFLASFVITCSTHVNAKGQQMRPANGPSPSPSFSARIWSMIRLRGGYCLPAPPILLDCHWMSEPETLNLLNCWSTWHSDE